MSCPGCGLSVAPRLLACPGCGRLVHAAALKDLAARAEAAELRGSWGEALGAWREALTLLPADAPQAAQVGDRVEAILRRPEARRDPALRKHGGWGGLAGAGIVGLLLAGLFKLPALAGLLGMFGVLWSAFGWKLAAGVLVSLYVHELGHAVAMWRRGMTVTTPMFVPGLGAYVRLTERPATPVEDNRVGLAGPVAGLGASVVAWAIGVAAGWPSFLAIASVNAIINMLNLCPVWQLDGARGFMSLTRVQRIAVVAALAAAAAITRLPPLLLPAALALFATVTGKPAKRADATGLALFLGLIAALALLASSGPGA